MIVKMRIIFCIFIAGLPFGAPLSEEITETYEPGLVLSFVPTSDGVRARSNEEPLGVFVDDSVSFNAANFLKSKGLTRYSKMSHGLLWQGFFKVKKPGKYVFAVSGGNYNGAYLCQFDAILSGEKLFALTGQITIGVRVKFT